jgi:hypothetical protein
MGTGFHTRLHTRGVDVYGWYCSRFNLRVSRATLARVIHPIVLFSKFSRLLSFKPQHAFDWIVRWTGMVKTHCECMLDMNKKDTVTYVTN